MLSQVPVAAVAMMCVLGTVRASDATPVAYDEAVSGDLGDAFPATLFVLDASVNTVGGTIEFQPFIPPFFPADFDNFAISIPAGMHLTDVVYSFQATINPGTIQAIIVYVLDPGNDRSGFPRLSLQEINMLGASTVHPFGAVLPISAGIYAVEENGLVTGGFPAPGFTTAYTWQFTVAQDAAAVPEPTTFCLLGFGLIGAAVRRRRGIEGRHRRFPPAGSSAGNPAPANRTARRRM